MKFVTRDDDRQDEPQVLPRRHPGESHADEAKKYREQLLDTVSLRRRRTDRADPRRQGQSRRTCSCRPSARGRSRTSSRRSTADRPRMFHGVQHPARRGRRLACRARSTGRRSTGSTRRRKEAVDAQAGGERAVQRAGVQDGRRVDRRPRLRPRLLRRAEAGRDVHEHDDRQEASASPASTA